MSNPDRKKAKRSPLNRLMSAMDDCALARAEAQWTNGYRAAKEAFGVGTDTAEHQRLYEKEQAQWKEVERREAAFRRLAQRILSEARRYAE